MDPYAATAIKDPYAATAIGAKPTAPSVAGLPAGQSLPGMPAAPMPNMQPSSLGGIVNGDSGGNFNPLHPLDNIHSNAQILAPDGSVGTAMHNYGAYSARAGAGAVKAIGSAIAHPIDTALGLAYNALNPMQMAVDKAREYKADFNVAPSLALEHVAGDVSGNLIAGEATGGAMRAAAPIVRGVGRAAEFAAATPDAQSLFTTRTIVPGSSGDVLSRALKPGMRYGSNTSQMFNDALPAIVQQNPAISTVGDFGEAADAAAGTNNAAYKAMVSPYQSGQGTFPRPGGINGNAVSAAQVRSVPFLRSFEDPSVPTPSTGQTGWSGPNGPATPAPQGILARTFENAAPYRRQLDIPTADALREGANQQLAAFYGKANGDQYAALANPETARVKAVGDSIREQLYPQLEQDYGLDPGTVDAQQQMYGKLTDVGDIANRRNTVFSRADPVSLAEKIATGHPGGITSRVLDFAGQRMLRNFTDSDALVRSAIDRFQNPTPQFPARLGVVPRTVSVTGRAMQRLPTVPGAAGIPAVAGAQLKRWDAR